MHVFQQNVTNEPSGLFLSKKCNKWSFKTKMLPRQETKILLRDYKNIDTTPKMYCLPFCNKKNYLVMTGHCHTQM